MEKNYNFNKGIKLLASLCLLVSCCFTSMAQGTFDIVLGASYATCEVSSDGTAYVVSQSGGVEPLVYSWEDGQDFVVAYNLMAGSIGVTVTDANGATATGTVEVPLSPESVWLMPVTTPNTETCECNGTMDPMAMLGLPPYTYAWSDGQTSAIATGLCPGEYTVTVTDSQGCANSTTAVVGGIEGGQLPEAGDASTTDPTTICVGDGISDPITVTVTGGTAGTDKLWVITDPDGLIVATPPGPDFDLEGAIPGTCLIYCVAYTGTLTGAAIGDNVSDIAGCFDITNGIEVVRNGVPTPATISTNDATSVCVGDGEDDLINPVATGATGENSIWVITDADGTIIGLPASGPVNVEGAPAGNCYIYHVTWNLDLITGLELDANIADLSGCFATSNSIEIIRRSLNPELGVTEITACGADDGALTVTGAAATATYEWSTGATTAGIDGLGEGTYAVTITDGACVEELSYALWDDAINIGDYVWYDNNENCRQDHYENGVPFVPVYLYDLGEDGVACNADDNLIATTGTDTDGYYLFECVAPGTYYVEFHATAVEPDYEYTCQDGAAGEIDSDADVNTGKTGWFTGTLTGGDVLGIDAGIHPICNDVNYGGVIGSDQQVCAGAIPNTLTSIAPAGGGGAKDIEYLWMCSGSNTDPGNPALWTAIPNSNSASYSPGPVYQTKYFVRCARRGGCDDFVTESNLVVIEVVACGQMLDFHAEAATDKEVDLLWTIDGDSESTMYYVERSFDGFSFDVINELNGQDVQDVATYALTDETPKVGRNFYRLKQVEANGNYTYSQVQELLIRLNPEQKFSIFPNPAREVVNVENIELFDTDIRIELMTAEGKVIEAYSIPAGTFQYKQLNVNGLAAGTYFVRVIYSADESELLKVTKVN